jgi:hypothetical protein
MRPNSDRYLRPTGDVSLNSGKICINKAWCDPSTSSTSPAELAYVDDTYIHSCSDNLTWIDNIDEDCSTYDASDCENREWDVPG